ncbi:hypothetical protein RCIP0003_00006 [Klebsiella phage RCIP0003]
MLQLTRNEARYVYATLKYLREHDATTTEEEELFQKVKKYLEESKQVATN